VPLHSVLQEAVIDTIVAKVQGVPGDDRCVLLLGYPDQMEKMMREANPGLARRFQLADAWHFEDYSSEDLLHIMRGAVEQTYGWRGLSYPALRAGVKVLEKQRRKPNFGNAGAVNNLLAQVRNHMGGDAAQSEHYFQLYGIICKVAVPGTQYPLAP
jgi:hypothetical protein